MKKRRLELCPDEPLSLLIEAARHETPKDAIRRLKRARRAIKREMGQIKKHLKRFPMSPRHSEETRKQAPSRPVQVVNARLGAIAAANQTPTGFNFCPPDPAVVRELLIGGVHSDADGAAEDAPPSPAPDARDEGDVLILAAEPPSPPKSANSAGDRSPL